MLRNECLACGSTALETIVELGMHSYADSFITRERFWETDPIYPLSCHLCENCGHVQTGCITDPEDRYNLHDYSYTSANSSFSRNHWIEYAKQVSTQTALKSNSFVLEIGSNDGFLAEQFQKAGHKVIGVDPSTYLAKLAQKERNIDTYADFFNVQLAEKILKDHGKPDLIVANNCLNHANSLSEFIEGIVLLLNKGGTFIFELPYWMSTIDSGRFDQIYHEHVSYFSVTSSLAFLKKHSMILCDVQKVNYHGGSIRVFAQKKCEAPDCSKTVAQMITQEAQFGLFSLETYKRYMASIENSRDFFLSNFYKLRSRGKRIVGIGAAAKGNTFLTYFGLGNQMLDYVTDSSIHKQGKYTPLTRIPIAGDEILQSYQEVYALILSWNLSDILRKSLLQINSHITFLEM